MTQPTNASPARPENVLSLSAPDPDAAVQTLVRELAALPRPLSAGDLSRALVRSKLTLADVAQHVAPTPGHYARRRIARTDHFEVLVLTWLPGQGGGAHDHAESLSGFMILQGSATETLYRESIDGMAEPHASTALSAGDVGVDPAGVIHSVCNDADSRQTLVSLHVYAPPLPELRGYRTRLSGAPPAAYRRTAAPGAAVVSIIGGGFSGVMAAAHLLREAAATNRNLHLVMIDRQTALGEGTAYRTPDPSHVLNLPASQMSAWPDRPDDFLDWARRSDPGADANDFLPRHTYGMYLHATLSKALEQAGTGTSVEFRRDEAVRVLRGGSRGWSVACESGPDFDADAVVLATGHRPPDDPLARLWWGPRARYIVDPWAELALAAIGAHESVCLLGTGLTAIDVLQTLLRSQHTAPIVAVSRRGLLPMSHATTALSPLDPQAWLNPLLRTHAPLEVRALTREIRRSVARACAQGMDWRQVIDGLRPYLTEIWRALPAPERRRFMRHLRAFWEVVRHRTAPSVADNVRLAREAHVFTTAAARVVAARGDADGVKLSLCTRGASSPLTRKFDWVINCTGPGSGQGLPPLLANLVNDGLLEADPLGLGVLSMNDGRARAHGRVFDDLLLVGTLRKPDLWESTAVPDLRVQAAQAAIAIAKLVDRAD